MPAVEVNIHERAARFRKVERLSILLEAAKIPACDVRRMTPDNWKMLAVGASVHAPSEETINAVISRLEAAEYARKQLKDKALFCRF